MEGVCGRREGTGPRNPEADCGSESGSVVLTRRFHRQVGLRQAARARGRRSKLEGVSAS